MSKVSFIIPLFLVAFLQCTTNRSTINDLASMERELAQAENFTDEDWDDYIDRYTTLQEEMDQREYTKAERKEIARIQGRITAQLTKKSIQQLKREMEELPDLLNGFLEGFTDEMEK